ncbi:MAG TPA: M50 family metallopeptidase [Polyangiaceae bacterium]|nr:M50 family metallopeptidase [Polyangiaceae bacterium]
MRGVASYLLVLLLLGGAAHFGASLVARWLDARFRWFDGRPLTDSRWRGATIRLSSSVAAWIAILALLMVGFFVQGNVVPSTRVEVLSGSPAEKAGLRQGDRIKLIDAHPIANFDEIRGAIQSSTTTRKLTIVRDGQSLTIDVTPINQRIGVSPIYERFPMTASRAFSAAIVAPGARLRSLLHAALHPAHQRTELAGPIGIARATRDLQGSTSYWLWLGLFSIAWLPSIFGLHAFDALTLWLFRATHAWARDDLHGEEGARLARRHQTLWLCASIYLVYGVLRILHETPLGDDTLLGIVLLLPAVTGSYVLVAVAGCQRWGTRRAIMAAVLCMTIPGVALLVLPWLAWSMRAELKRQGFRVAGWLSQPSAPNVRDHFT